jgi:hypothetical protein
MPALTWDFQFKVISERLRNEITKYLRIFLGKTLVNKDIGKLENI